MAANPSLLITPTSHLRSHHRTHHHARLRLHCVPPVLSPSRRAERPSCCSFLWQAWCRVSICSMSCRPRRGPMWSRRWRGWWLRAALSFSTTLLRWGGVEGRWGGENALRPYLRHRIGHFYARFTTLIREASLWTWSSRYICRIADREWLLDDTSNLRQRGCVIEWCIGVCVEGGSSRLQLRLLF